MSIQAARIGPDDPQYLAVLEKRFNKRFSARPDYVCLVGSTADCVAAVQQAVDEGRRVAVTSGGHCLEGFVSDPDVRVIIDMSSMKRVYYDAGRRAVAVEAGATVGETFGALCEGWGVVVPLGESPQIGMGGHVPGGAFGFLCRELGLAADYLYAVEVVTVDAGGRASSTVATREPSDPHRSAILDIACTTGWLDHAEDAANLRWVRTFYRDLFSETGGVPVPCEAYDGALINHPDTDLADPRWNTSGVPWSTLYYNANYPRLQRIKARWDPKNIFQHALSIRA
jgi:FAD/FMN-containing dehydrogenase